MLPLFHLLILISFFSESQFVYLASKSEPRQLPLGKNWLSLLSEGYHGNDTGLLLGELLIKKKVIVVIYTHLPLYCIEHHL